MRALFRISCLAALLSGAAAPSLALQNEATPVTVAEAKPPVKICRMVEVSGSIIKKGHVCKTRAEWRQIVDNGNRVARAIVESGGICAGACGGN